MRTGQPSSTAMLVAASVARLGAPYGLPAAAVQLAERAVALGAHRRSAVAVLASHRLGRWVLAAIERAVIPGLAAHHCARKAWLWQRLQQGPIALRPIIWLGVGFDGLGLALRAQDSKARIVETDHPDTLQQRRALLGEQARDTRAIGLPDQLDALIALCAAEPCTLICEGVLMYLPPRPLLRALHLLAALPAPPRLIFSALDTQQPCGRGFRRPATAVHRWLDRHGEPFRWRACPTRVHRCLAAAGYAAHTGWDGDGFGEYIVEADIAARRARCRC